MINCSWVRFYPPKKVLHSVRIELEFFRLWSQCFTVSRPSHNIIHTIIFLQLKHFMKKYHRFIQYLQGNGLVQKPYKQSLNSRITKSIVSTLFQKCMTGTLLAVELNTLHANCTSLYLKLPSQISYGFVKILYMVQKEKIALMKRAINFCDRQYIL